MSSLSINNRHLADKKDTNLTRVNHEENLVVSFLDPHLLESVSQLYICYLFRVLYKKDIRLQRLMDYLIKLFCNKINMRLCRIQSMNKKYWFTFSPVWLRNRTISAGLEPVLSHINHIQHHITDNFPQLLK